MNSSATSAARLALILRITGVVQGVGFRPFVWRLAHELGLRGYVNNGAAGVTVHAEGPPEALDQLIHRLRNEAPPLARIDGVASETASFVGYRDFSISESGGGRATTTIGADVAICRDCLDELFDPASRRWRYGFITCTHCGPRYTVTRTLPYDRSQTSLAPFPLCPACAREYTAPADRRFHAETTCCAECGPQLSLTGAGGSRIAGDPIAQTLALLQSGRIVAIKGLGGFHLACDARNASAVLRLRERKNREAKPFAVMAANVASLTSCPTVTPDQRQWLESRERPIVLIRAVPDVDAHLPGVAPQLLELGVMLPTTPIHYLLFHEAAGRPAGTGWLSVAQDLLLVMTSANPGGEPIVRDNCEAHERLGAIADAILEHDRDIVARCDDSVVRSMTDDRAAFIRRSRGYVPNAIRLPDTCINAPPTLSVGAYLKNTICVTRGQEAFLSAHIGDLDTAPACRLLDETVSRMLDLLDVTPAVVAHDLHPDYYSTRAAIALAERLSVPTVPVQHHHAHIGAVCAEHHVVGPVLGLALDGVGLGSDGTAWGGELLRVDGGKFERLGHLRPLPLPGGDRAAEQPWRMAAAALHELGLNAMIPALPSHGAANLARMLTNAINCPPTTSLGRHFDAAAGLLGVCQEMQYEAQAAILLEQLARLHIDQHGWPEATAGAWQVDTRGILDLRPLLGLLVGRRDIHLAAALFHRVLADALTDWVGRASQQTGISTVACGGGCLLNSLLSSRLMCTLGQRGIKMLQPTQAPPGDAGIALGQAWIALKTME